MDRVRRYLTDLTAYPDRHVGGPGNRAATRLFAETVADFGFNVSCTEFPCIEWEYSGASLRAGDDEYPLAVGPYSLPFSGEARLVAASTTEELEKLDGAGAIVLLHGPITSSQLMPRNFVWYNPEEHRRVYRALDAMQPGAVLGATGVDPGLVGAQYPFPLFEDGDFDVPNAFLKDVDGERLLAHVGETVTLAIDSTRVPTTAEHVVARKQGEGAGRIVVSAHIDSRKGSPGGLDNASGVATVLALAELLADRHSGPTIELVPFNGEDNYANPGEMMWAAENEGRLDEVLLGINIDDSGQAGSVNDVSFYGCPPEIEQGVRAAMAGFDRIEEGPQWYQGDHMILVQAKRPCIAVASSEMVSFMAEYAHTERDTADLADPGLIAETARFLVEVIDRVSTSVI